MGACISSAHLVLNGPLPFAQPPARCLFTVSPPYHKQLLFLHHTHLKPSPIHVWLGSLLITKLLTVKVLKEKPVVPDPEHPPKGLSVVMLLRASCVPALMFDDESG